MVMVKAMVLTMTMMTNIMTTTAMAMTTMTMILVWRSGFRIFCACRYEARAWGSGLGAWGFYSLGFRASGLGFKV